MTINCLRSHKTPQSSEEVSDCQFLEQATTKASKEKSSRGNGHQQAQNTNNKQARARSKATFPCLIKTITKPCSCCYNGALRFFQLAKKHQKHAPTHLIIISSLDDDDKTDKKENDNGKSNKTNSWTKTFAPSATNRSRVRLVICNDPPTTTTETRKLLNAKLGEQSQQGNHRRQKRFCFRSSFLLSPLVHSFLSWDVGCCSVFLVPSSLISLLTRVRKLCVIGRWPL